jgi:hypothetical protein
LVALFLSLAAFWIFYLGTYQVDDAYIVYRYAQNLAAGHGFVFNPGERVEGVSCFLWVLLLAPFAVLSLPLPAVASLITICCGLAALFLLAGVSARLRNQTRPDTIDWCPSILLALSPSFAYWSSGALETVPFTLLLILLVRSHLDEKRNGRGMGSALWAALALLTRPEAPLLAMAFVADRLWGQPRAQMRRVLHWMVVVFGVFAAFLLFRWLYFGDWLPNTYYAKTGGPLGATLYAGWVYDLRFFANLLPSLGMGWLVRQWLGLGLVGALLVHGIPGATMRPVALLLILLGVAVTINGGDWMILSRFWVPGLPFVYLLLASLLRSALAGRRRGSAAIVVIVALLGLHSLLWGLRARRLPEGQLFPQRPSAASYSEVGRYLSEQARPGDAVALMDIGQIGYETGLPIIDISGLADRRVARSPGGFLRKRYPVTYLLDRDPRFFVLRPEYWIDGRISRHPLFRERYRRVLVERLFRADLLVVFERVVPEGVDPGE